MTTFTLTPAEREAAAVAIRDWLATYSKGVNPEGYEAARSALTKIEREEEND